MYNRCDTSKTGEVSASSIMRYLQTLTAQSAEEDRLVSLRQLLDPDLQDPHVSRETFQSAMRSWIPQCRQDSSDIICLPQSAYYGGPVDAPTEGHRCFCERKDLSGIVADLEQTRHQMSEQNSVLLRMLAQCEDENLQLSLEITELQTKLSSVQRSAINARTVAEELEETRQTLKDVQEIASHTQRSFTQLTNETERLRFHIRVLEDKVM
ncbi:inositol 1,4,5-triphosphate receptor associated 2-like [Anableps anableps]